MGTATITLSINEFRNLEEKTRDLLDIRIEIAKLQLLSQDVNSKKIQVSPLLISIEKLDEKYNLMALKLG